MLPLIPARLAVGWCQRQRGLLARTLCAMAAHQGQEVHEAPPLQRGLSVVATRPAATQLLAHFFACTLHPADCYLLYGSVGAGKSYFSRAFIRAAADDEELPVPSPTFLLQNVYTDHRGPSIHHFDLYRLTQQYDLGRLDLASSFSQAVSLVEWPERLGTQHIPKEHLAVHISVLTVAEQKQLAQELHEHAKAAGSPSFEDERGEESEEDGCGDWRWRRILLTAVGQRWQPRLELLEKYLQAEGLRLGCHLDRCSQPR